MNTNAGMCDFCGATYPPNHEWHHLSGIHGAKRMCAVCWPDFLVYLEQRAAEDVEAFRFTTAALDHEEGDAVRLRRGHMDPATGTLLEE